MVKMVLKTRNRPVTDRGRGGVRSSSIHHAWIATATSDGGGSSSRPAATQTAGHRPAWQQRCVRCWPAGQPGRRQHAEMQLPAGP